MWLLSGSLVIITLIAGCASVSSQKTALGENETSPIVVTAETIQDRGDVPQSLNSYTLTTEEKINQAEYLCTFERYVDADSILRSVLVELGISIGADPVDYQKNSDFLSSIFGIYRDLIPEEYVTEDISKLIDKFNLLSSMDSIVVPDDDSILPAILEVVSKTSFDIPIVFNDRVQKACLFYLLKNRKTVENWVKRSSLYITTVRKMFADSALPPDLAYLPLIESGFNAHAYSRAHAAGIWQFIQSTGKLYGLRNSYWVDERRDPLKATTSAIRYLKKLYNDFGNWHLALAAYNCGEGGVARAINKAGVSDYWQLQLPRETMNYVPLYLASVIIIKNLETFGFNPIDTSLVLRTDVVSADACIDLAEIAKGIQISEDSLRLINPHILHWCTPPDVTNTRLYIPEGKTEIFNNFIVSIPDEKKVKWYRYRIGNGDNLLSVGKKFKVSTDAIKSVNRLSNNRIVAGKYLFIPIPVHGASPVVMETITNEKKIPVKNIKKPSGTPVRYKVKKGDTVWGIADLFNVDVDKICQWNGFGTDKVIRENDILEIYDTERNPGKTAASTQSGFAEYIVKRGDTPYSIAGRFDMSVIEFCDINGMDFERPVIVAGATVKVKKGNLPKNIVTNVGIAGSVKGSTSYQVASGDNLFRIAQNFNVSISEIEQLNNLTSSSVLRPGDIILIPQTDQTITRNDQLSNQDIVYYEVKRGDNLWRIAGTFGIPVEKLCMINNLTADSVIMPGDVIKVMKAKDL
jgi:membrane-bound lytic murein transglycosylase D